VEIEELVEPLAAHVSTEFDRMISNHLAEVVRPLKCVANLRQLAFKIVSDNKTAARADERHAFMPGNHGCNSQTRIPWIGETLSPGTSAPPGIMQAVQNAYWMIETSLPFTKIIETEFIDSAVSDGPSVIDVPLLHASLERSAESRYVRARCLEIRKWIDTVIVFKVVVDAQMLRC